MAMNVEVGLLSGKTATVTLGVGEDVETLTRRAQTALGVGRGRLLDSAGNILDVSARINQTKLQNGDTLTLHISTCKHVLLVVLLLSFLVMDRS